MSVKERLKRFIKYKDISIRGFERTVGLSYGYVNNMRVSMQPDKIANIADHYPELNTGWLLTGEGEMLKRANHREKTLNEFSDLAHSFLKAKTEGKGEEDLRSMNVGDLLFLQMLEKIKELEDRVKANEESIEDLKKRALID